MASVITISVTINQSDIDSGTYAWPVTINSGTQENPITITLGTNIELSSDTQYFIIGSEYITIDGNNKILTISNVTYYPGFVKNGYVSEDESTKTSGFNNITIKDLRIYSSNNSTLADYQGWFCQSGFAYNTIQYTVNINNCINNGNIEYYSGGILGAYSKGTANNCINNGIIKDQEGSGGIFGPLSSGIANYCINTKDLTLVRAGGIFGTNSSGIANNCTNNGNILTTCGGIFGDASSGTANNCINNGNVSGDQSGGIFSGYSLKSSNANNCTNNGNISGTNAGGIFGADSFGTAISCINKGNIIGEIAGGIFGGIFSAETNATGLANNCINNGNIIGANSGGIFSSTPSNALSCINNGIISGNSTGGIFGAYSTGTANECINNGLITDNGNINDNDRGGTGGIFGSYTSSGTANNCISISNIIGYKSGGIFGAYADNMSISNNSIVIGKLVGLLTGTIYGYRGNDTIDGYVNYEIYSLTSQYANSGLICKRVIDLFKKNDYDANNAFPIYSYYMNKYSLIKLNKKSFQRLI